MPWLPNKKYLFSNRGKKLYDKFSIKRTYFYYLKLKFVEQQKLIFSLVIGQNMPKGLKRAREVHIIEYQMDKVRNTYNDTFI